MTVYKTLVSLDFAGKLFEAKVQTQTGKALVNKYQAHCINNPITCNLVNGFIKEAKECMYDSGIVSLYESIASVIADNKYSWSIATVCENINNNSSKGNYLNRRAAKQVEPLLEMNESDVVSYIKSGAFKSVMYVESFRNIAKSVFKDQPIVESNAQYNMIHPISFIEQNDDAIFFEALGDIYKLCDNMIYESSAQEVSSDFITISRVLESNNVSFNGEVLTMNINNRNYSVTEAGKCTIDFAGKMMEVNTDQLRENNNITVSACPVNLRNNTAFMLEGFAKIVENFDSIGILNNVSIVNNANDKFIVIENAGNAYTKMIQTNHTQAWKYVGNIAEACNLIKKNTRIDLSENYKESIEHVVESVTEQEAQQIKENLESDQMIARKQKIAELTERFKSDPVRLRMLSQIAAELNDLEN